jgi:ABC-type polysaccharide/polyol phosphate transport system ATPase subunit
MSSAVELRGVGKQYTKYDDVPLLVTSASRLRRRNRHSKMWAVRGVDLEIAEGASFGIIGRNGSGKTTLMSMMAGVTAPTEGMLRVRGRIAPLISVGVGFHRELTGRENVYLNGTILGLTRKQVDQRLESIVDFAEIEEYLDTPVKFYSSGMYVRLGFSVAIHSEPDVVLVDEVLAVGDLRFQVKCLERMAKLVAGGTTVVMVSHNMAALQRLSHQILLLDMGRPVYLGTPEATISRFHQLLEDQPGATVDEESGTAYEPGVVEVSSFDLLGPDGGGIRQVEAGTPVSIRLELTALAPVADMVVGYCLTGPDGQVVYMDSNLDHPFGPMRRGEAAAFTMSLRATLPTGSYSATAWVQRPLRAVLARSRPVPFFVSGRATVTGAADLGGVLAKEELSSELPEAVS